VNWKGSERKRPWHISTLLFRYSPGGIRTKGSLHSWEQVPSRWSNGIRPKCESGALLLWNPPGSKTRGILY